MFQETRYHSIKYRDSIYHLFLEQQLHIYIYTHKKPNPAFKTYSMKLLRIIQNQINDDHHQICLFRWKINYYHFSGEKKRSSKSFDLLWTTLLKKQHTLIHMMTSISNIKKSKKSGARCYCCTDQKCDNNYCKVNSKQMWDLVSFYTRYTSVLLSWWTAYTRFQEQAVLSFVIRWWNILYQWRYFLSRQFTTRILIVLKTYTAHQLQNKSIPEKHKQVTCAVFKIGFIFRVGETGVWFIGLFHAYVICYTSKLLQDYMIFKLSFQGHLSQQENHTIYVFTGIFWIYW